MKKKNLALGSLLVVLYISLCGCSSLRRTEDEESAKETYNKEYVSKLDNTLVGYGQGVIVDDKNVPVGAKDFNEKYSKYNAKALNDTDKKTVTLTFDQGYENGYTEKILDVLKKEKVSATFFVLEDYAKKNPDIIKRMIKEGHIIGNHSVSHYSMPSLSDKEAIKEIMDFHKYMKSEYKYTMTKFRPPKGEFSERTLEIAKECGYETELWSFAYADWDVNNQPSVASALEKIKKAKHNGAIYLLHSVSKTNTEVLERVIDDLKSNGYKFID